MTATAQNILMAGVANLVALLAVFVGVGKEHVFGMVKVMAHAVVTKSLSVALVTGFLFTFGDRPVFNCPAKISVRIRNSAHNYRCVNQCVTATPHNGYGVAQVAFNADGFNFIPCLIHINMLAVVTAEAPQRRAVAGIVGVGLPVQVHIGKIGA